MCKTPVKSSPPTNLHPDFPIVFHLQIHFCYMLYLEKLLVSIDFCTVMCFVRGKLPSEVDSQFLSIASELETYGLDARLVTASFSNVYDMV